jgi:hypothetical protein
MEVDVSACHSDLPQKPWSATPTRKYQPSLSTEVLLYQISVSSTPIGLNSGERMAYYELLIPGGNVIVVHMDEDQLTESMLGKRTVAVEAWGQAPDMEEPSSPGAGSAARPADYADLPATLKARGGDFGEIVRASRQPQRLLEVLLAHTGAPHLRRIYAPILDEEPGLSFHEYSELMRMQRQRRERGVQEDKDQSCRERRP